MADDDVRKFDAKRTVLARGLPLATSTAKVRALPSSSHPSRSSRARSLNSLGRSADFWFSRSICYPMPTPPPFIPWH